MDDLSQYLYQNYSQQLEGSLYHHSSPEATHIVVQILIIDQIFFLG